MDELNEPERHDERHERLCAFLLGELDGDEAAAVEREIETDDALAAEAERLRSTLGLLREHLPVGSAPSERSAADVAATALAAVGAQADSAGVQSAAGGAVHSLDAARSNHSPRPAGWDGPVGAGGGSILVRQPWLSAAAAVLLMGGAAWIGLGTRPHYEPASEASLMADAPREDARRRPSGRGRASSTSAVAGVGSLDEASSIPEGMSVEVLPFKEPFRGAGSALEALGYLDADSEVPVDRPGADEVFENLVDRRKGLTRDLSAQVAPSGDPADPVDDGGQLAGKALYDAPPAAGQAIAGGELLKRSADSALLAALEQAEPPDEAGAYAVTHSVTPTVPGQTGGSGALRQLGYTGGAGGGGATVNSLTPEQRAQLQALGYNVGGGGTAGNTRTVARLAIGGGGGGGGPTAGGSAGPSTPGPVLHSSPPSSTATGAVTSGGPLTGSGDFFIGQSAELDRREIEDELGLEVQFRLELGRRGFLATDDEAIARQLLESLGIEEADLPETLRGLGYLDAGYEGDLTDERGREAVSKFVAAKRDALLREQAERRLQELLTDCRRRSGESLRDMFFRHWGERPFIDASADPLSTFAVDVDTASYALARGMLMNGVLPTRAQVRTEEFVNYFDADVPAPKEDVFAIHTDLAPSAFGPADSWMLRVALAGREVTDAERKPLSLTFVIDNSGSMKEQNRLELVKDTLRQLLTKLDSRDSVTIIGFSNSAQLILPRTSAANRGAIEAAILSMVANGGTSVEAGLTLGYQRAVETVAPDMNHRVVLLSDGVGNIGETDQTRLLDQVAGARSKGVYLNTIGVGMGNHNDVFLEQLANGGDGICNYVDSPLEARRALVENFTGAFETIARDVKIQVEFDGGRVGRYRLLGYENRALADREFRQDDVDAGEVGAGHVVVALYELEGLDLSDDAGPIATVRVRFKPPFTPGEDRDLDAYEPPADDVAREIAHAVTGQEAVWAFEALPLGFARAICAAQFAEVLRRSNFAAGDSVAELEQRCLDVADRGSDESFRELAAIVAANRAAIEANLPAADGPQAAIDKLKYLRYELARESEASGAPDANVIASLEGQIAELEEVLREAYLGVALGESDR